jgi:hypothetical protein
LDILHVSVPSNVAGGKAVQFGRSLIGIAARFAAQVALGLAAVTVTSCATEPRTCYEIVEHPEFGRQLRPMPCPQAAEP